MLTPILRNTDPTTTSCSSRADANVNLQNPARQYLHFIDRVIFWRLHLYVFDSAYQIHPVFDDTKSRVTIVGPSPVVLCVNKESRVDGTSDASNHANQTALRVLYIKIVWFETLPILEGRLSDFTRRISNGAPLRRDREREEEEEEGDGERENQKFSKRRGI